MSKHSNSMNGRPQQQQPQNQKSAPPNERQPLIPKNTPPRNQGNQELQWDTTSTESEAERQDACRGVSLIALSLFLILITLRYASSWFFSTDDPSGVKPPPAPLSLPADGCPENVPFCKQNSNLPHVVKPGHKGFPSFWDYAPHGAIDVSYDGRSFLLNSERALFLSGSMHPVRATKQTWENTLDLAVKAGQNMVSIYVFWAEHQPLPDQEMDWTLPAGRGTECQEAKSRPPHCGWSLADAIRAAAQRGLFVHARIGPYVCAEYSYGGIPEWVPLHSTMEMRRYDPLWLDAMERYVASTIQYLTDSKLFAYQGGPIIAGQIENELGEEDNDNDIPIMDDDIMPPATSYDVEERRMLKEEEEDASNNTEVLHKPSVQEYADWCGTLVQRLAPNVIWSMCNGLSANNTIVTCNGDCSTKWLEDHGSSGRIQVDQPAMWSEDEGGFQLWGDVSRAPSDYFWGRTARAMAYDALRWFARGGSHLNYYMFWGSYNRGRASAAGIMNGYATDAAVCSSGEPHQPKFGHFEALHQALRHVAPILLDVPTALNNSIEVEHKNDNGEWKISGKQRMFTYRTNYTRKQNHEAVFVENDSESPVVVKLRLNILKKETLIVEMNPFSAILIKDGAILFDSFEISTLAMAYQRRADPSPPETLQWMASCAEPIGAPSGDPTTVVDSRPVEQTSLNIGAHESTDYVWYETQFRLNAKMKEASIFVESQKASALTLYIDKTFQGEAYNHQHAEGNATYQFLVGPFDEGLHTLAILSESLGYHNLIGRWGAITTAKVKGITGDVIIASSNGNQSLVDNGSEWKSSPGLNGAEDGSCRNVKVEERASRPAQWTTANFHTPAYDPTTHALFLNVTQGRGHFWLNDHDLGRFWDIKRGDTDKFSQQFYFLPFDYLSTTGVNKLVFFDSLGNDLSSTQLVLSWLEPTDAPDFQDEVDYPQACI